MQSKDLITQFMQQTGAPSNVAKETLIDHGWDLINAVKTYKFLQKAPIPTAGHEKNLENDKKLKRGVSTAIDNRTIVYKARAIVQNDLKEDSFNHIHQVSETSAYSFLLPDFENFSKETRDSLYKDLIEESSQIVLEDSGHLNWWHSIGLCQKLWPLATTGDGNCLLHAASLGMWGFHDRMLILRKALLATVENCYKGGKDSSLWRRWRYQQTIENQKLGLTLSDEQWDSEWNTILRQASIVPRGSFNNVFDSGVVLDSIHEEEVRDCYESLEEFHVFVLAQVLHRPVIVIADSVQKDSNGEAFCPNPFPGLYLPLECDPSTCHKSPLLLTYHASHFSALVTMEYNFSFERQLPCEIPLVDFDLNLLPVHYPSDPGPEYDWNQQAAPVDLTDDAKKELFAKYLELNYLPLKANRDAQASNMSPVRRSNSLYERTVNPLYSNQHQGSSNDLGGSRSGTLDNRAKLKDHSKMHHPIDTLSKSLGSLGRSFSRKLKKIGKGKVNKGQADAKHLDDREQERNNAVTRQLKDGKYVLCARLLVKRLEYQDLMMNNYLERMMFRGPEDTRRPVEPSHDVTPAQSTAQTVAHNHHSPEVTNDIIDIYTCTLCRKQYAFFEGGNRRFCPDCTRVREGGGRPWVNSAHGNEFAVTRLQNDLSSLKVVTKVTDNHGLETKSCRVTGCPYFGSVATDYYCTECFKIVNKSSPSVSSKNFNSQR